MKKLLCWLLGHKGGRTEKSDCKDGFGTYFECTRCELLSSWPLD